MSILLSYVFLVPVFDSFLSFPLLSHFIPAYIGQAHMSVGAFEQDATLVSGSSTHNSSPSSQQSSAADCADCLHKIGTTKRNSTRSAGRVLATGTQHGGRRDELFGIDICHAVAQTRLGKKSFYSFEFSRMRMHALCHL